ncbi:dihydrolipoyl dehydrogenase [bacterium]|nr:dihydrolipoyl dehydrogenase [bacterium]
MAEFDLLIIGAGSAGYAAARVATEELGARVGLVDKGPLGGLCILDGCMPSKALIQSSNVAHQARTAKEFGIQTGPVLVDFAAVMARKNHLVEGFAAHRAESIAELQNTEFICGEARFVDRTTLVVGERRLTAPRFVLALGSTPTVPRIPGLAECGYLLSDAALKLDTLPASLIIIGGGVIALELGQFFARLGTQVTIVEAAPRLVSREDPEVSEVITRRLRREAVAIHVGVKAVKVEGRGDRKRLYFEHPTEGPRTVEAESILVATGREPNVRSLDLEKAGVEMQGRRLVLDRCLRTTNPAIYAAGDVTGGSFLVHTAIAEGELAARNSLRGCAARPSPEHLFVSAAYTEPNMARVGLSEAEAREIGREVVVGRYPFSEHGKAEILGETDGFVKLIADPRSGEILGGTVVGPEGAELIHEIACAITLRATIEQFLLVPHLHPTLSEIWTYPAEDILNQIRARARVPSVLVPAGYNDTDETCAFEALASQGERR